MPKDKIRESGHFYKLQVLSPGIGVVHNVPLLYSVYLRQFFRIPVLSEKAHYFERVEARIQIKGIR
jgi:hypothetical protein